MSVDLRVYDNEHGDPVVVMVTTGTFDVSRLAGLLKSGRCEDHALADALIAAYKRHNGGRSALKLLAEHGGPDLLKRVTTESGRDVIHDPLTDWCACEPNSGSRCGYRLLADAVVEAFNPPDGEDAEVAICVDAINAAAAYVRDQRCSCAFGARFGACPRCRALGESEGAVVQR